MKQYLEIGSVVSTHGVRGEVRINPSCDSASSLQKAKRLYTDPKGQKSVNVLGLRQHGNVIIAKLEGIDTVEAAQALRGTVLYADRNDVFLPEGSWFLADLIGCKVADSSDLSKAYGIIKDIMQYPANDVWVIVNEKGEEFLFPAVKAYISEIDVENELVLISPIKGMFENEN